MENKETVLYMQTETSPYLVSYILITKKNRVIVVDGGRPDDLPLFKELIGGRKIAAWFFSHPHDDHTSGFVHEVNRNGLADFDVDAIYHHVAAPEFYEENEPNNGGCDAREMWDALAKMKDKVHVITKGDRLTVDEVEIECLYSFCGLKENTRNDSSVVLRMQTPGDSVLFLGDLGPAGGDVLFRECRDKLKSDIVQMAHHGHMCVSMNVYEAISPRACMWNAPVWLYDEVEMPKYLEHHYCNRMYGTALTRRWMERLGVTEHYVTGFGTQRIVLHTAK